MDKGLIMSHIKTHDQPFIPLASFLPLLWKLKTRYNHLISYPDRIIRFDYQCLTTFFT